jgi:hypothetical protein
MVARIASSAADAVVAGAAASRHARWSDPASAWHRRWTGSRAVAWHHPWHADLDRPGRPHDGQARILIP